MDTIMHLNALVIKKSKELITDDEMNALNKKVWAIIEEEGYNAYGKPHLTSDKQLKEDEQSA